MDKTLFHNIDGVLLEYRDDPRNTTHVQHEKMQEKSIRVRYIVSTRHAWVKSWEKVSTQYRLFGIPVLKIVSSCKKTTLYLFDFIPFFKIKRR